MTTVDPSAAPDRSIRGAERADLLGIVRIENASFSQPWPYDAFESFLAEPGFLVATEGGRITGYVVADVTPSLGCRLGHIKDLAVHPDRRGTGIGSTLLGRALVVLAAHGATSVKLEVRPSNDGARSLYRRFGFEPTRRLDGYYGDGEDALVMVRDLG
ncbi:ribosomal protein S18-alanine N-acetyltransferase [Halobacteria archaeon AArc-dxtr1]|nr:ribosomal protein S18-alanine N-acetyltransferase [Halobacteria archaeon AArc-dxtr1]